MAHSLRTPSVYSGYTSRLSVDQSFSQFYFSQQVIKKTYHYQRPSCKYINIINWISIIYVNISKNLYQYKTL